jgi:hypothetical protein
MVKKEYKAVNASRQEIYTNKLASWPDPAMMTRQSGQ